MSVSSRQQALWLVGAIAAVGALDVGMWGLSRERQGEGPPALAPFDAAQASAIELGRVDERLVLSREGQRWEIAPSGLPADPVEVEALLGELADGVRGELVLQGPFEPEVLASYGLGGGAEVRVDVRGQQGLLSSLYVGHDAGGGNTWIRLPDEDRIAQARIGGRARFERKAASLRDRRLVELDPAEVQSLELRGGAQQLVVAREGASWRGEPFAVDVPTVDELVRALCSLRAVEVTDQDAGIDWTLAEVVLHTGQGPVELQFGQAETSRYVRRIGAQGIGRVKLPWVDRLARPDSFADRALWSTARVDGLALRAPGREGLLEREGESFVLRRPAHVDLDPNQLQAVLAFLARPRVLEWDSRVPDFGTEHLWTVQTAEGPRTLALGPAEGERVAVRTGDRAGWLDARLVRAVEALFGG
jgi:hypothetical protein